MDKIAKHLRDPALTKNDCHQPMLTAIVQLLVTRAQANLKTTLMTVKSHIGIKKNEMADKLANQAAHHAATVENFNMDVSQDHLENLKHKFWPQHKVTQQNSRGEEVTHWQNVRDLKTSLKDVIQVALLLQQFLYDETWTQSTNLYQVHRTASLLAISAVHVRVHKWDQGAFLCCRELSRTLYHPTRSTCSSSRYMHCARVCRQIPQPAVSACVPPCAVDICLTGTCCS